VAWRYPQEWLDALARMGIAPLSTTSPRVVREHVNDLYRFEIRRLKRALLAKAFPKDEYIDRVITLRKKYWPLSLTPDQWERICSDDDA
jgi:hypothetical protein